MPKRAELDFHQVFDWFQFTRGTPKGPPGARTKHAKALVHQHETLTKALLDGAVRSLEISKSPEGGLRAMLTMDTGVVEDVSDETIGGVLYVISAILADRLTPPVQAKRPRRIRKPTTPTVSAS
jgi:hypothetical protein